jgi:hypothetical protein
LDFRELIEKIDIFWYKVADELYEDFKRVPKAEAESWFIKYVTSLVKEVLAYIREKVPGFERDVTYDVMDILHGAVVYSVFDVLKGEIKKDIYKDVYENLACAAAPAILSSVLAFCNVSCEETIKKYEDLLVILFKKYPRCVAYGIAMFIYSVKGKVKAKMWRIERERGGL